MALSEKDVVRFGELGVAHARTIDEGVPIADEVLVRALGALHRAELSSLSEEDRREAERLMLDACKRRIASMRRKTTQLRRPREG